MPITKKDKPSKERIFKYPQFKKESPRRKKNINILNMRASPQINILDRKDKSQLLICYIIFITNEKANKKIRNKLEKTCKTNSKKTYKENRDC